MWGRPRAGGVALFVRTVKAEAREEVKRVKKRIALLLSAMALAASGVAPAAFAAIDEGPGKGNPDVTSGSGKCPPGQNKDTSPGGLKKCP
jgi:hypothetical protein